MLSNTYIQIALSNENDRIRKNLVCLRKKLRSTGVTDINYASLYEILNLVVKSYREFRERRFERYLLPTMKNAGPVSTFVLEELESLKNSISDNYFSLTSFSVNKTAKDIFDKEELKEKVDEYCDLIHQLLDKEEREIFELARFIVGEKNWFAMAETFIGEDKSLLNKYACDVL